jgi:large subunit ribosomal protein L2
MELLLKKLPITSGQRHTCLLSKKHLTKIKILKNKSCYLKNNAGRNNQGCITVARKGGGHKKRYRIISYERSSLSGVVESIEYDPYRSSNIARVFSKKTNEHHYILAPNGLAVGHYIQSEIGKDDLSFKIGNLFYLKNLPLGVFVHNIFFPQKKTAIARAAGCSAQLVSKDTEYCRLRLSSGEDRLFKPDTQVTLGVLSNKLHKQITIGKAGRSRWLNRRPTVRGVAMNPIDHPHGGGQGKTGAGRPSVTPWGKLTKGQPTRKTLSNKLIIKRKN